MAEMVALVRPLLHLVLHIAVPAAVARLCWPERWMRALGVMLCAMLIDLDHLLASPVYDPDRCSLQTHLLHGPGPLALYLLMLAFPRLRMLAAGLLIHLALDGTDCLAMGIGR